MNWRLVMMIVAAPSLLSAQTADSLLVFPAKDVHCTPARPGAVPAHLVVPGAIEREYDIPEAGIEGRHLRVAYDSNGRARRVFAVRTTTAGMQTFFVQSTADTLSGGFLTVVFVDTARLRGNALPSREEVQAAITTRTVPLTAADRQSAARLAASLWRVPCNSHPSSESPAETLVAPDLRIGVELTAPFIVVVVDTMPPHAPPGAHGTVVRRPGLTPVDAVVIRRDAMNVAVLDTMLTTLRIIRTMEPAPDRMLAVSVSVGVSPSDSAFASRLLERLTQAPVHDVPGVGRGAAIEVPVLESRSDIMIRRRSPPN